VSRRRGRKRQSGFRYVRGQELPRARSRSNRSRSTLRRENWRAGRAGSLTQIASKQPHGGHCDSSAEANVHVGARRSMTELIIAREIKIAFFLVPVIEGQGIRIERAPDDFRLRCVRRQVREGHKIREASLAR